MIKTAPLGSFNGANGLSISIAQTEYERYDPLVPSVPFRNYAVGLARQRSYKLSFQDEVEYIRRYYEETLRPLDVEKVRADVEGKVLLSHGQKYILNYRHIVAYWLGIEAETDLWRWIYEEGTKAGFHTVGAATTLSGLQPSDVRNESTDIFQTEDCESCRVSSPSSGGVPDQETSEP